MYMPRKTKHYCSHHYNEVPGAQFMTLRDFYVSFPQIGKITFILENAAIFQKEVV